MQSSSELRKVLTGIIVFIIGGFSITILSMLFLSKMFILAVTICAIGMFFSLLGLVILVINISRCGTQSAKKVAEYIFLNGDCTTVEIAKELNIEVKNINKIIAAFSICNKYPKEIQFKLRNYKASLIPNSRTIKISKLCNQESSVNNSKKTKAKLVIDKKMYDIEMKKYGFVLSEKIVLSEYAVGNDVTLYIDEQNSKLAVALRGFQFPLSFDYSDVLSYELYEDGQSRITGNAGKSLIGLGMFGVGGAVVGSAFGRDIIEKCNSLVIIISLNDLSLPQVRLDMTSQSTTKASTEYKSSLMKAKHACAVLELIINKNKSRVLENCPNEKEIASDGKDSLVCPEERLLKIQSIYDKGLITKAEYDEKRREIITNL